MSIITSRYHGLCCPACRKVEFEELAERIVCTACGESYAVVDGAYPCMLPRTAEVSHEEVAVQDRVAANYQDSRYKNPWSRRYHQWWTQLMVENMDNSGRILDNGCGIGELSEALPGAHITGLDISTEMVRIAGTKYERALIGDSQLLPFEDATFDVVYARSLLHHLPEPERGLAEMARVLRPGGSVVSIDTNSSFLSRLPRIIANKGEHFSEEHKNLDRNMLTELFSRHFTVKRVKFFGYVAYPIIGFPDLADLFRYFPLKPLSYAALTGFDAIASSIPLVRTQSWAILVKAVKGG